MKRLWKPMLCMLLAVLMLSSCSGQPSTTEQFPEVTQALGPATATPVPTAPPSSDVTSETGSVSQPGIADAAPQSIFDTNPYDVALDEGYTEQDALNEENYIDPDLDDGSDLYVPTPTGTVYPYAGSTPIPLDAGAEDMQTMDDAFEVTTDPNDFSAVREKLEAQGLSFLSAEVQMIPQNTVVPADEDTLQKVQKLLEMLEDNDDVQNVWHNAELPEEPDEE